MWTLACDNWKFLSHGEPLPGLYCKPEACNKMPSTYNYMLNVIGIPKYKSDSKCIICHSCCSELHKESKACGKLAVIIREDRRSLDLLVEICLLWWRQVLSIKVTLNEWTENTLCLSLLPWYAVEHVHVNTLCPFLLPLHGVAITWLVMWLLNSDQSEVCCKFSSSDIHLGPIHMTLVHWNYISRCKVAVDWWDYSTCSFVVSFI